MSGLPSLLDDVAALAKLAAVHIDDVASQASRTGVKIAGSLIDDAEWPLIPVTMAEALTKSGCAAVQRNLAWMQARGLVREMTGQGRYRMWRATNRLH